MDKLINNTEKKGRRRKRSQNAFALAMRRILRNKGAIVSMCILAAMYLIALFAPYITPYDYDTLDIANSFQLPSWEHLLGTDELGRDILSRIMYGSRYSLTLGILSSGLSVIAGIIIGAVAGYYGGRTDLIIMRFMDIFHAIPGTLLAVIIASTLGTGFLNTIIALSVGSIVGFARQMRASMLNVRAMEYVEAARSINCSNFRIIAKHVIPNAITPVIVQFTLISSHALITSAGLSYIGLGIQPPTPEWGAMMSTAKDHIRQHPHLIIFPGIAVMIAVLCMNLIGDAVRDALDPKLKR